MSMFKGIFANDAPSGGATFHPVTSAFPPNQLFGPLEPKDTEWAQLGSFATETQVWYQMLESGVFLFCEVIHSSVGLWTPTIQFTCKIYDPSTRKQTWKSSNVAHFTCPPPASSSRAYDKRSSQSDKFKIIHTPATDSKPESYKIDATPDANLQLSLLVERPAHIPGFKLGAGPKGGFSYFGTNPEKPDGHVIHRFWPRTHVSGIAVLDGKVLEAKGIGMFVHAIQGMRPNLVAQRWNFGHFMSLPGSEAEQKLGGGVSAIMMEFQTLEQYGRPHGKEGQHAPEGAKIQGHAKVNVGCVVVGDKLVAVTGETQWPGEAEGDKTGVKSRAVHQEAALDKETGYNVPGAIKWVWEAPKLDGSATPTVVEGETVKASMRSELGGPETFNGLLEKVDVLQEIPYMVRKVINYATGTKPYIYQYWNPASMEVAVSGQEPQKVDGTLYCEASFISNAP